MLREVKNQQVQLTTQQEHPEEALAEDFKVLTSAEAADMTVPAVFGDLSSAEHAKLLKESSDLRSTTAAISGKSRLDEHPTRRREK